MLGSYQPSTAFRSVQDVLDKEAVVAGNHSETKIKRIYINRGHANWVLRDSLKASVIAQPALLRIKSAALSGSPSWFLRLAYFPSLPDPKFSFCPWLRAFHQSSADSPLRPRPSLGCSRGRDVRRSRCTGQGRVKLRVSEHPGYLFL